jgi:hypothetical protein
MTAARANNEPIEEPLVGTDQLAADLPSGEQLTNDDKAPAAGDDASES